MVGLREQQQRRSILRLEALIENQRRSAVNGFENIPDSSATSSANVTFTATSNFTYEHGFANRPNVAVQDSDGLEVGVAAFHEPGVVTIIYRGTLTDAKLILT